MGPPQFTRGVRGWVSVSKVSFEGLYGRISFPGLSYNIISLGAVDSRRLEGSLFVRDHYGVIVHWMLLATIILNQ